MRTAVCSTARSACILRVHFIALSPSNGKGHRIQKSAPCRCNITHSHGSRNGKMQLPYVSDWISHKWEKRKFFTCGRIFPTMEFFVYKMCIEPVRSAVGHVRAKEMGANEWEYLYLFSFDCEWLHKTKRRYGTMCEKKRTKNRLKHA